MIYKIHEIRTDLINDFFFIFIIISHTLFNFSKTNDIPLRKEKLFQKLLSRYLMPGDHHLSKYVV